MIDILIRLAEILKFALVRLARSTVFIWINRLRNCTVKQYKYVHLMLNDKFNKPFVDFLSGHFDTNDHLVICERVLQHPMPTGANVLKAWTFKGFDLSSDHIKKIFCHSLCERELIDYFMDRPEILKKTYWIIWGGDLYNAPRDARNDYVRSHFRGWITVADGDDRVAEARYGKPKNVFNARYTTPITAAMIQAAESEVEMDDGFTRVQINNSCDESTIEMLDVLSAFKKKKIIVRTIVSYGQTQYRKQIIARGKKYFGDRFEAVDTYMSPGDFARYMASNDIVIFNQRRQQGLGNCNLAFALGAKVYVRSEVSSFEHYLRQGIIVYDSLSIRTQSFDEFASIPENIRRRNREKSLATFDEDELVKLWQPVFSS